MLRRKVIIDCDTGVDDALALLLALRYPEFHILGITTVAGNVKLTKVVRNTLVVVQNSGKEVPVYQGASRALKGRTETAEYAHGSDGLGDIGFPDPELAKNDEHAVDFLVRTFVESSDPVELITLGPLTNIALALLKEPTIENKIKSLVMMAGGIDNGNTTPAAEFNIYADPESADLVFRSGIKNMTIVPLEPIAQGGKIHPDDVALISSTPTPWCQMTAKLLESQMTRWKELTNQVYHPSPCDLTAMSVAIDPGVAQSEFLPVVIETRGEHTRGMTLIDRRPHRHFRDGVAEPNINVVFSVDNQRHRKLVVNTLINQSL